MTKPQHCAYIFIDKTPCVLKTFVFWKKKQMESLLFSYMLYRTNERKILQKKLFFMEGFLVHRERPIQSRGLDKPVMAEWVWHRESDRLLLFHHRETGRVCP